MIKQYDKYLGILILFISANLLKADIDTTLNKFEVEINSEILLGQSVYLSQKDVENVNRSFGVGINVGYKLKPSQLIKLSVSYNKSNYDYRIIKRDLISPTGLLVDREEYREDVEISNASLGLIYSIEIEDNFFIDFELLAFKIFSEERNRTDSDAYDNNALIVWGIDHATNDNYFGFRTKFRYAINSHIILGVNMLASNEKISVPKIVNDSKINLFLGTSIGYRI